MLAIGWTCLQNGEMIHESGIALNWFYCAKQWLVSPYDEMGLEFPCLQKHERTQRI